MEETMKRFLILSAAVFAMFLIASCGGSDSNNDNNDNNGSDDSGFNAVDVGECRFDEPAFSFKDRIYTEPKDEFSCKEYVEVTEKKENTIKFNWFGEMRCGEDWEYGYKVAGIENNVLKVNILERDTDLDLAADCDSCCYLMPIEYTASTAEEIESVKAIEINYEGKNHKATFQINEEAPEEPSDPETPDEEVSHQCEYDGERYDLGYKIASNICQTSTCSDGFFDFLDYEACDYCYYYEESESVGKQAAIGDKYDFTCPDGSKVDWCECVADDSLGQKWKCADRVDLNCPKE